MTMDFNYFNDWAKDELNIHLNAYKEKQLQRRITTIMKSSGANNLKDYAKLIKKDESIKRNFLDYITINVTEFYRNKDLFEEFEEILLNSLIPRFRNINIWSAACSNGSEPYSLAMILDKNNVKQRSKIQATDIDNGILEKAKLGAYKKYELKNVDKADLDKYFTEKNGIYHINDEIKGMVNFKKHDLLIDRYDRGFHVIVCRNVTIYFKNESKDEIYRKMRDSLVPGGVFFIGATESIYNPEEFGFKKLSTFIYEKL
ncbi:MAG: protein-glutamate O-methyltransferase CheR [Tissierellaceae bacterium]|nr:protein-glutamate O-methyltransferase CheR [Tissierellaceae bacterium]